MVVGVWVCWIGCKSFAVITGMSLSKAVSPEDGEATPGDQEPGATHTQGYCKNDSSGLRAAQTGPRARTAVSNLLLTAQLASLCPRRF